MGLYLGSSEKLKLNLNNMTYLLNIYSALPEIEDMLLCSSDDRLLKEFNGLYLTVKDGEPMPDESGYEETTSLLGVAVLGKMILGR